MEKYLGTAIKKGNREVFMLVCPECGAETACMKDNHDAIGWSHCCGCHSRLTVDRKDCHIGQFATIYPGTVIGLQCYIDDGAIVGRAPKSAAISRRQVRAALPPLTMGNECLISANAIVYRGTTLGNQVMVGDLASVREDVRVGDRSVIGRLVMVEPHTVIGADVVVQTGTHITADAVIEDKVFFGDEVSTSNDNSMRRGTPNYKGPHIKFGARIGSNATILPGIVIGEQAVVAAGAVVTHDVPDRKVVMGCPAKVVRDVPESELI